MISLSFSVHSNKGVFALLLGSGVSTAAGIPTGWQIILDMIAKIAAQTKACFEPDPERWYRDTFGVDPNYSDLVGCIAKTATERNQFLKQYIEPTGDDARENRKIPSDAHRAIAELVSKGYIKVIITTNFDRLLEISLQDLGISPTVIDTPDAIKGALPLTFAKCTIVKVHGDYLDTRIKNTPDELKDYSPDLNGLLDRIFDEFGLIICGWSAEWDFALRDALKRCSSRRFSTYWCTRGKPTDSARDLIEFRQANQIQIKDADSFFQELSERVLALETFAEEHPLSPKIAVSRLKNFLSEERFRIRAHDFVMQETNKLYSRVSEDHFSLNRQYDETEFLSRVKQYDLLTVNLRNMFAVGSYWGNEGHRHLWLNSLERVANPQEKWKIGDVFFAKLALYPSLILLYAAGIGSVASGKWKLLAQLLNEGQCTLYNQRLIMARGVNIIEVMGEWAKYLPNCGNSPTPLSDHLHDLLRDSFREIIPDDSRYSDCFDLFEYLSAVTASHYYRPEKPANEGYGPVGRFGWRFRNDPQPFMVKDRIEKRIDEGLPVIQIFPLDSLEYFRIYKTKFDEFVEKVAQSEGWL
jgi:hypothetical protein